MSATRHFIRRAHERLGCSAHDATRIAEAVVLAIRQERRDLVEYVARVNRDGCRLFRFGYGGRVYYALVDTDDMQCVTVMPPGFVVRRQGKAAIKLKETDI